MQDRPTDFVPTEAEKDTMKRKRSLSSTQVIEEIEPDSSEGPCSQCSAEGCYRPCGFHGMTRKPRLEEEEEDEGEDGEADEPEPESDEGQPNLQRYLDRFDISDDQRISMLRALASYLVSLRPKKTTAVKKARKSPSPAPPSQKPHWMKAKKRRK